MGRLMLFLFYFFSVYPLISVVQFIVLAMNFKYIEDFNTEHPLKGESIRYKFNFSNESLSINPFIFVRFKYIQSNSIERLNEIVLTLGKNKNFSYEFEIKCPYRGIYTVGIEQMKQYDIFKVISYDYEVWARTFYVYPRIINLDKIGIDNLNNNRVAGLFSGRIFDNTLYHSLKGYQTGESIKNIAWKKFASSGNVYLKTYDATSHPGIDLYLDLRREREADDLILEREDCSVEILVSLVKYFFDLNIPLNVYLSIDDNSNFYWENNYRFTDFYKSTINIYFESEISSYNIFKIIKDSKNNTFNSVIFITHNIDPELIDLMISSDFNEFYYILNQSGISEHEKNKRKVYIDRIKEKKGNIISVNSSGSIKEDLEL